MSDVDSNIHGVADLMVGVWTPYLNGSIRDRDWPRLVFLADGRCVFEEGDYPAVSCVDHFKWRLVHPTVLELSQHESEFVATDMKSTKFERDDSCDQISVHDFTIHQYGEHFILEFIFGGPLNGHGQFAKITELVDNAYQPNWHLWK